MEIDLIISEYKVKIKIKFPWRRPCIRCDLFSRIEPKNSSELFSFKVIADSRSGGSVDRAVRFEHYLFLWALEQHLSPFHLHWGRSWIYYSIQSICLSDSFLEVPDELFRWKIDASARQLRGSRSEAKKERKYYLCETSHASAAAFRENKNKNNAKIYIDR